MTDPEPAILEHADKRYGDVVAVKDLSLTLHAGQVAVLLGPNGAGKTTTLSMLVGLRRPTAGTATLFGLDPRDERARWRTGVMLQDSGVHATLTVGELIRMFSALYPRPLPFEQVVALATLKDLVGRKAGGLSGGQRQRLYFALAVCGDPDLIFLDEPTVAMDVESRAAFLKEIRALVGRGKAVVMTTHYLREAEQVADRVVVIHRGALVMDGSTSEVSALATGKWVSFRTSDPLDGDQLEGLPVDQLDRTRHPDGERVRFHTGRPEDVLAEIFRRGLAIEDLEVTGADLEEAVTGLLRRVSAEAQPPASTARS